MRIFLMWTHLEYKNNDIIKNKKCGFHPRTIHFWIASGRNDCEFQNLSPLCFGRMEKAEEPTTNCMNVYVVVTNLTLSFKENPFSLQCNSHQFSRTHETFSQFRNTRFSFQSKANQLCNQPRVQHHNFLKIIDLIQWNYLNKKSAIFNLLCQIGNFFNKVFAKFDILTLFWLITAAVQSSELQWRKVKVSAFLAMADQNLWLNKLLSSDTRLIEI